VAAAAPVHHVPPAMQLTSKILPGCRTGARQKALASLAAGLLALTIQSSSGAVEALVLCSRGGDPMVARIGVLRALDRNVVREFSPDRKEHYWGKLKRDQ
jgi:hypothetical protein